jgi:hypothetical protein
MVDGLAEYRLGRFAAAERQSSIALAADNDDPQGWNMSAPANYLRAMALSRLGRHAEATTALDRGSAIHARAGTPAPIDDNPLTSHDQRICEVLRREAELLLLDATFPADPFAR